MHIRWQTNDAHQLSDHTSKGLSAAFGDVRQVVRQLMCDT